LTRPCVRRLAALTGGKTLDWAMVMVQCAGRAASLRYGRHHVGVRPTACPLPRWGSAVELRRKANLIPFPYGLLAVRRPHEPFS
jgi:hypothetical protein